MNKNRTITIDRDEKFEYLPQAPIVEAVIHWQARAENPLEPKEMRDRLTARLSDYPRVYDQQQIELETSFAAEGSTEQKARATWQGIRLTTADGCHIAHFSRDGLVFSRLKPYEKWESFQAEGMRLWRIYLDLAAPREIQRLGVRFINQIDSVELDRLNRYLMVPPRCPKPLGLPIHRFVHRDTFDVPGNPYHLTVTQTIRQPKPGVKEDGGFGLILDFDVFSTRPTPCDDTIVRRLADMRWLKNKAFFSFLKPQAIERFKGRQP